MSESIKVGAYFYPISFKERQLRSDVLEDRSADGELPEQYSEPELARSAPQLFPGHDQPRTYCLPHGPNAVKINWDDGRAQDVIPQLSLAEQYGLSHLIFNSYTGIRNDVAHYELAEAARVASVVGEVGHFGLRYARMHVFESPRIQLPAPRDQCLANQAEAGRQYDITSQTARLIVDTHLSDWYNPAYLRVGDRPYVSILMPDFGNTPEAERYMTMASFVDEVYKQAERHSVFPYLVGVMRQPHDVDLWARVGVEAVTQYCHLADMGPQAAPVQDYRAACKARRCDWQALKSLAGKHGVPFMPSPAVGWDASPRGERGYKFEEVVGMSPYTPIVTGGSAENFAAMLRAAMKFTQKHVRQPEQIITIYAWNEITEGAALLPRLHTGGALDFSYLEAVRSAIHSLEP